jgi:hypothetical protein
METRQHRDREGMLRWEVEDDPDVWVPHVGEMREGKVRGNFVHIRIHSLIYVCKWARYIVLRT